MGAVCGGAPGFCGVGYDADLGLSGGLYANRGFVNDRVQLDLAHFRVALEGEAQVARADGDIVESGHGGDRFEVSMPVWVSISAAVKVARLEARQYSEGEE